MICIMDCTFVSPAFQTSRFRARLWTQIVEIGLLWEHAAEHAFEESLFLFGLHQMLQEAEEPVIFASCRLGQVWLGAKVQN